MEKEVVITMKSIQAYDREESDRIDFTTDGLYTYENGIATALYYESEVTGMAGTRTIVTVKEDEVVVKREGLINSEMAFREGTRNKFLYDTQYGSATVGLDTKHISKYVDENGGTIEIDYVLDLDHSVAILNKFCLNIREIK